jgi:anti-anti-sigma factor
MSKWEKLQVERIIPENPKVVVFRLSGALTSTRESYDLLEQVKDDTGSNYPQVVINLEQVTRITSAGVGILCACFTSILRSDGRFCLVGVSDRNRILMEIVGLWSKIDHFETEADVRFDRSLSRGVG